MDFLTSRLFIFSRKHQLKWNSITDFFAQKTVISAAMSSLYIENSGGKEMTPDKIGKTFAYLEKYPESGSIMIIEKDGSRAGYALLIYYWSNEYGRIITHIDEIYVLPRFRKAGLASSFINYLIQYSHKQSVAFQLQVMPSNKRALKLYLSLGFIQDKNTYLIYESHDANVD